jgi:hypothetical protein
MPTEAAQDMSCTVRIASPKPAFQVTREVRVA